MTSRGDKDYQFMQSVERVELDGRMFKSRDKFK